TTGTTGTTDSAEADDSGEADGVSIPLRLTFSDGVTGVPIADAEFCAVLPAIEPACQTSDAAGMIETTWETAEYTDVLSRLTHPDYLTMLYTGRYEQDVHDGWTTALESNDAVSIGYIAFTPAMAAGYISTGDVTIEAGTGMALYWMVSADESSLEGAVITLEDASGAAVGDVRYQSGAGVTLDPTLTATSTAGVTAIANIPPGEYTLRVTHDSLTCLPGFAFSSEIPNVTTVPVEADSQTIGNLFCGTAAE
ncbi:MAG TPA: hypothetical protein DFR83_15500, partial [Deltaproteobacteria bacterium]|nr:hypothetical protein [Deltaproteobacteria bacterium]